MNSETQTPSLLQSIQRFADGELPEDEQVALLLELDENASDEWRTLALALAEDKMMREALQGADQDAVIPFPQAKQAPSRPLLKTVGVAAAIVLAFLAGSQIMPPEPSPDTLSHRAPTAPLYAATQPQQIDSEILRRAAEYGYEARLQTDLVTAELPSGDSIVIPVSHLAMRETL